VSVGVTRVLPDVPLLQVTVPAQPAAVKVADEPAQMVAEVTTRLAGASVFTTIEAVVKQAGPVVQVAE
jgi:hypothetical protein